MKTTPLMFMSIRSGRAAGLSFFVALAGLFASLPVVRGDVVISDSFALSATRTAGSSLNGTTTETGNLTWTGYNLVFGGDDTNGYITTKAATSGHDAVPFAATVGTITISADINPGTQGWVGLGFKNADGSFYNASAPANGGQFWVEVNSNGTAYVYQETTTLAAVAIPGFTAGTSYAFSLSYSFESQTLSVTCNGSSLFSKVVTYSPVINYGGIEFNSVAANSSELDNFSISTTSAIPEPAATAVLTASGALGFALCFYSRGRRR